MASTRYYTVDGRILGQKATGGSRTDYVRDGLGSVVATTDSSGTVVNTYRYKPYGAQLSKTGAGADPRFEWIGIRGYSSEAANRIYVRARFYSANTALWHQSDAFWPWEPAYTYVRSQPTALVDPSGNIAPVLLVIFVAVFVSATCVSDNDMACKNCKKDPCKYVGSRADFSDDPTGWVACCCGEGFVCVRKQSGDPVKDRCLKVHEARHIADGACDGSNVIPQRGQSTEAQECLGWNQELDCLYSEYLTRGCKGLDTNSQEWKKKCWSLWAAIVAQCDGLKLNCTGTQYEYLIKKRCGNVEPILQRQKK